MIPLKNRGTCPVCGMMTSLSSLKHHVKACARKTLANLRQCPHCKRPVQNEDLSEHQKRCKEMQGKPQKDTVAQLEGLRNGLSKLERGELGLCDPQGLFQCGVCGKKFTFGSIISHAESCRKRLSAGPETQAESDKYHGELQALKKEIEEQLGEEAPAALKFCIERLKAIFSNATGEKGQEKKYRRLKRSNAAFDKAVGRWTHAVAFMIFAGFKESTYTAASGDKEAVLQLDEPLTEQSSLAIADVLREAEAKDDTGQQASEEAKTNEEGEPKSEGETKTKTMEGVECKYCSRMFRFDRIAKHETRCMSGKPQGPKFDSVTHHLRNTPGAKFIPQIKAEGPVSAPLTTKKNDPGDGLSGCPRCGRRFNADAFEKHTKFCKANSPRQTRSPRIPGSSGTAQSRPSSATGRPRSTSVPTRGRGTLGKGGNSRNSTQVDRDSGQNDTSKPPAIVANTRTSPINLRGVDLRSSSTSVIRAGSTSTMRSRTPSRSRANTPGRNNGVDCGNRAGRAAPRGTPRKEGTPRVAARKGATTPSGRAAMERSQTACLQTTYTREIEKGHFQETLRGMDWQAPKVAEAEKFVDYDQVDTLLDSWLNE